MSKKVDNYHRTKEGFFPLRRYGHFTLVGAGRKKGGTLLPSDSNTLINLLFLASPLTGIASTTKEELADYCNTDQATLMKSIKRLYENRIAATVESRDGGINIMISPFMIEPAKGGGEWKKLKQKFDSFYHRPDSSVGYCEPDETRKIRDEKIIEKRRERLTAVDIQLELSERQLALEKVKEARKLPDGRTIIQALLE
jgi:hypothetical protein